MKLRYLFSSILASVLMFAGCVQESIESFDNIKLSQTYLSIPVEGGSVQVTVTATEDWAFETKAPEWLAVNVLSGKAGETTVSFTAEKTETGREAELQIKAGNNAQYLRIRQGSLLAEMATCAEIIAGPDGKNYKAKGICTSIASDYYGNWYLNDGTGEVYIYGTVNADGEYDWASFGIEVGDSVYVEGPKKTYSGTIELVNVTVSKVVKALLSLPKETGNIDKTAQDHVFQVAYKGKGVFVEVDAAAEDWITYKSMDFKKGVPTKLEPNPADTAVVTVSIAAVPEEIQKPREGKVVVKSYLSEKESTTSAYTVRQMGHTPPVTPINTLAQQDADDKKYVRVEGIVAALSTQGLVLVDETGALVVYYGSTFEDNNEYKIGNKIGVQGTVGINNFGIQVIPDYDELLDKTTTMTYGDAVLYDGNKLNAMLKTLIDGGHGTDKKTYYGVQTEYATMSGELIYDGSKYFNLNVEGAEKQASLYNPDAALKLADYNGKNVVLKGYVFSVSCSKDVPTYVYMMVTDVELDSVIYKESFNESLGGFTIENVRIPEGKTAWTYASYNNSGYAKASGYFDGAKCDVESRLVSPEIDLTSATAAALAFEHTGKFFGTMQDEATVLVKKVGGEWAKIAIPNYMTGSDYNFVNSGDIDLSAYLGSKIQIAFNYISTTAAAGTWEVKNVVVK